MFILCVRGGGVPLRHLKDSAKLCWDLVKFYMPFQPSFQVRHHLDPQLFVELSSV